MNKIALQINKICLAAMFLALGWLMPFITAEIPQFGQMLLPMHLPVFLCGFILGPVYGAFIGFITPITRSLIFSMPPIVPTGLSMAFELMVYGAVSGLLFIFLVKKIKKVDSLLAIYIALISAMILGRGVGGIFSYLLTIGNGGVYDASIYWASFFANGWPGMILQIVLVPAIIRLLYGLKLLDKFIPNYHLKKKEVNENN